MNRTLMVTVAGVLFLSGCGAPQIASTPAPPNALDCAFSSAVARGYGPTAGGKSDGYYRIERLNAGGGILAGRKSDNMTITFAAGVLRIESNGFDGKGMQMGPSDNVKREAQEILTLCGNKP